MLKHVIFDCDGVLVDSEPLSMRADVTILRRFGVEMSEHDAHVRFVGRTFQAMLDDMAAAHGIAFPPGLQAVKDQMLVDLYHSELRIVDGVADVLAAMAARGITCSVASNSPRERVALALELTGITRFFNGIVTFEDVVHGKPAPDVFIEAAKRSGHARENCLIVEDSATGTTAGVASGIRTVGFVGTHHAPEQQAEKLKAIGAASTISAMKELASFLV